MKRLTKRCNGVVTYIGASNEYETGQIACEVNAQGIRELLERVAAYEDTTVTPLMCAEYKKFEDEAISKGITIKRIIELMNADAAGRVAILPCAMEEVQGKLICDPLTVDKPEAIGPEVRRKAREALMEELEAKGLICYQMLNGVLYAGVRVAAPEKKT